MVDYFEWSDDYSVSVRKFDDQHRGMINLINAMIFAVEEKLDRGATENIIMNVLEFTSSHFRQEEKILEETGFCEYYNHRRLHEELLRSAFEYNDLYRNNIIEGANFALYLMGWVLLHINKEDKKYTAHLNSLGIC